MRSLKVSIHSHRLFILLALGAACVSILMFRRGYETVTEVPPTGLLDIHNGKVYLLEQRQRRGTWTASTYDVNTHQRTQIGSGQLEGGLRRIQTDGSEIAFITFPKQGAVPSVANLHRLPLNGGEWRVSPISTPDSRNALVLAEDHLYWLQEIPGKQRSYDLMACSEDGDAPRALRRKLPISTRLSVGDKGAFLVSARRDPTMASMPRGGQLNNALVWKITPDGLIATGLDDFSGAAPPVQLGDKFYWVEHNNARSDSIGRKLAASDSAVAFDPSNRKRQKLTETLYEPNHVKAIINLREHKGKIIAQIAEAGVSIDQVRQSIAQIEPDGSLTRLANLTKQATGEFFMDGDWVYFPAIEERENWMDWSPAGLIPDRRWKLMRCYVGK
jgi:hypothetical protein